MIRRIYNPHPMMRLAALGQGTPVDLRVMFWGVSLFAIAAYLLGQNRRTPAAAKSHKSGKRESADPDAVSALQNLGYSQKESMRAVLAAQRRGARGFDAIFERAQRSLE